MAYIQLHGKWGDGKCALVDDWLYDELSKINWTLTRKGYAMGCINGRTISMHRWVVKQYQEIPEGRHVDHINRDRLDNRLENLRIVTPSENTLNSRGPFNPQYVPTDEDRERWAAEARCTREYHAARKVKPGEHNPLADIALDVLAALARYDDVYKEELERRGMKLDRPSGAAE
jgi:hypothetical protein